MSSTLPACPRCHSQSVVKNEFIHNGKQHHQCKDCGRQFVENPQQKRISDATKALIDDLPLERISMAGIARVAKVAEPWLQQYINQKYADFPRSVEVSSKKGD